MGYSNSVYASTQTSKEATAPVSFAPQAPAVQPKAEAPQSEIPELNPDTSIFQTDWDNPFASCFGSGASPTAPPSLPIQAKLTVGAVGDKYEQEADTVAAQVVKSINSPQPSSSVQREGGEEDELQMKPLSTIQREGEEEDELQMKPLSAIQREGKENELQMRPQETLQRVGHEGGAVSSGLESQIHSAKGGGQSLDSSLQQSMGQAMGADFSSVKVHTDSQSDQLNQSIQAKAFTTGQDVFFRSGEYNPGNPSGQELIAHELTHVVQQNGGAVQKKSVHQTGASQDSIQRVKFDSTLNKFYSETLEGQKIDATNAVVTATSNMGPGGGHTAIYIERLKDGTTPENKKIDLVYGSGTSSGSDKGASTSSVSDSSSGSSSSSGGTSATDEEGVTIRIKDGLTAQESSTKSWVVKSTQVDTLIDKAKEIQSNQSKYDYTLLGISLLRKKVMNCAKFGEIILKAAGIKASAGKVFKLPSTLTKGDDVGHEVDQDYADAADQRRQQAEQQRQQREQQRQQEEQQRQQAQLVAQQYANVPKGKKKATFTDGKTVSGSRDQGGALTTQFTFRDVPQAPTDITSTPFAIYILPHLISLGRVQIEDQSPRGSYYVRIQDVLATNGNFVTT